MKRPEKLNRDIGLNPAKNQHRKSKNRPSVNHPFYGHINLTRRRVPIRITVTRMSKTKEKELLDKLAELLIRLHSTEEEKLSEKT